MANIEVVTITVNQLEQIINRIISKKLSECIISEDNLEKIFSRIISQKLSIPQSYKIESIDGKMNQKEAAKFLGKTEQTIILYRKKNLIPHHIWEGTREIIFYKHELIEFMKNSQVNS